MDRVLHQDPSMDDSAHLNGPEDFDETWILHLQEFLETLDPQIRETDALKILEDFLSSLESTDPNFHRYSLIRQIRKKLELDLTPLIDDLIKHHEIISGDNMLASDVSDKLTQSEEFVKTSTSILDYIRMAAENLTEHLNSDTFDFSEHSFRIDDNNRCHGYESMCSTNDGMDLMFMSPNHYKTLAKDLDPINSLDTRLKSLTALQQVPQTDLLASDAWDVTRRGLLCALDDENEEVHVQALTFLSNLFVSGSSHVVKEYFMILIENMIEYFNDTTSHMVCVESGLDLGDRRNIYLVRKFRLLHQIQEELPSNWLRYSDKYIEDIIRHVFQLLQYIPTPISDTIGQNLLSPLHFFALLDPLATWFKYWMHGLYGRSQILRSLKVHSKFLLDPIQVCVNLPSKLKNIDLNVLDACGNEDEFIYTSEGISYTYFLHCLSIIGRLMLYDDGYQLLNVTLPDGKVVNRKTLILSFIDILKLFPSGSLNTSKSSYHPVFLIVDIFSSFVHNGVDTCREYLCDDEVCKALVEPLKDINENSTNIDGATVSVVADILAEIASSECGRSQLIYSEISLDTSSPIHLIAKALCCLLDQSSHDNLTINSMCALMSLCCQVYMTCEGANVFKQYNLDNKMYICLTNYKNKLKLISDKFKNPNDPDQESLIGSLVSFRKLPYHELVIYKCYVNFVKEMLDNLSNFCMTPKGVELVEESGGLHDCVIYLFDKYQSYEKLTSKVDKYGCEMILSQVSITAHGVAALNKAGYVASLLERSWAHLEGYSNDYTRIILSDIPEDLTHRTTRRLFVSMIKLLSNFDAVYEIFRELQPSIDDDKAMLSSDDQSTKTIKNINDFYDFFSKLILIDSYDKQTVLSHPEQTHFFALNVLGCIITCLDTMLFLESKFHFKESLLNLQAMGKLESNTFIIDQCSVKRNQILVMAYLLGGIGERFVPPDNLTQDSSSPYPWPLFSSYPLPDVYNLKVLNPSIAPVKKKSSFESYLSEILATDWSKSDKQKDAIDAIRIMYVEEVKTKILKGSDKIIQKLMGAVLEIYLTDSNYNSYVLEEKNSRQTKMMKLRESDELAIDMVARYGHVVRAVTSVAEASDILKALFLQWNSYVNDSQISMHLTENRGFDWFVAIVGLIYGDKKSLAFEFLKKLYSLVHFRCIWFARFPSARERPEQGRIHPVFSKVCHYVEFVLQKELPQVYAAFRLSGYSPSQICYLWYRQCFLNFMDWVDIVWYICTSVVMGIDYQIYFTLAVFKHLEEDILFHTQKDELVIFLRTVPLKSFYFSQHIDYMKKLELDYRAIIIEDLLDL